MSAEVVDLPVPGVPVMRMLGLARSGRVSADIIRERWVKFDDEDSRIGFECWRGRGGFFWGKRVVLGDGCVD